MHLIARQPAAFRSGSPAPPAREKCAFQQRQQLPAAMCSTHGRCSALSRRPRSSRQPCVEADGAHGYPTFIHNFLRVYCVARLIASAASEEVQASLVLGFLTYRCLLSDHSVSLIVSRLKRLSSAHCVFTR